MKINQLITSTILASSILCGINAHAAEKPKNSSPTTTQLEKKSSIAKSAVSNPGDEAGAILPMFRPADGKAKGPEKLKQKSRITNKKPNETGIVAPMFRPAKSKANGSSKIKHNSPIMNKSPDERGVVMPMFRSGKDENINPSQINTKPSFNSNAHKKFPNEGRLPMREPGSRPEIPNRPDEPMIGIGNHIDVQVYGNPSHEQIIENSDNRELESISEVYANSLRVQSVGGVGLLNESGGYIELQVYNPSTEPQTAVAAFWFFDPTSGGLIKYSRNLGETIAAGAVETIRINPVTLSASDVNCHDSGYSVYCSAALRIGLLDAESFSAYAVQSYTFSTYRYN